MKNYFLFAVEDLRLEDVAEDPTLKELAKKALEDPCFKAHFDKLDDSDYNQIHNDIIKDEDFKALMTKHEVKNEYQYFIAGALIGCEKSG